MVCPLNLCLETGGVHYGGACVWSVGYSDGRWGSPPPHLPERRLGAGDLFLDRNPLEKVELAGEQAPRSAFYSVEDVEKDMDRDTWMSPEEAVDYGLISRIVTSLKEIE